MEDGKWRMEKLAFAILHPPSSILDFMRSRVRRYRLPLPALRRVQHGVADALRLQRVAKRRARRLAVGDRLEEIGDLMDERVLVADLQPRHPPVLHVRVIAVGDVDRSPAAQDSFVL